MKVWIHELNVYNKLVKLCSESTVGRPSPEGMAIQCEVHVHLINQTVEASTSLDSLQKHAEAERLVGST